MRLQRLAAILTAALMFGSVVFAQSPDDLARRALAEAVDRIVAANPQPIVATDPRDAVVRIPSHGCSGTVIETSAKRTVILSCAHAFRGPDAQRPLTLTVPWTDGEPPRKVAATLKRVDHDADLSLVEVAEGPFPFVCPVAPPGAKLGRNVWSVGYDEMKWPAVREQVAVGGADRDAIYTLTAPNPGRSGGGLIDLEKGLLFGVCVRRGPNPYSAWGGTYVGHARVLGFLAANGVGPFEGKPIRVEERRDFGPCPGGVCPVPWRQ
jgi:hypothetical protein